MKEAVTVFSSVMGSAKRWAVTIMAGVVASATLALLMGGSSTATGTAFVIVIGAVIILRLRKKKAGRFGQVARGSEVEDHTNP